MRKSFKIGEKEYKFKKDAIEHYRVILNSYDFGESLNKADFKDIMDLFDFGDKQKKYSQMEENSEPFDYVFSYNRDYFFDYEIDPLDKKNRYIKCPTVKPQIVDYNGAIQLSKEIQILKNERYYCIVRGNFVFAEFIEAFITCRNMLVKELIISTSTVSQYDIDCLSILLDKGYVEKLNLIVNDYFFSHEKDNLVKYIYEKLDIKNKFQLSVCNNNSKIILIHTEDSGGRKYIINTSSNINSFNSIEQFFIEENEELYDFNKTILDEITHNFQTINKSIEADFKEDVILYEREAFNENSKINSKIINVKVSKAQYDTKCFEVFYDNGDSGYVSYRMILNNTKHTPESLFDKACRNAIQKDLLTVKQNYFDQNSENGFVKCQETGVLSKWLELVVDHRQPNTFSMIVERFKEVNDIDLEKIDYTINEQNHIIFEDSLLGNKFIEYHKDKASLRIVRIECNLSRTGMARIKRTSKDLTIKDEK